MKYFFLIIIILCFILSCKEKDESEYKDIYGDIIYTDSFSPKQWENPAGRKKTEVIDMDIGKVIRQDIMNPKFRKILRLLEKFVYYIVNNKINEINNILTPSAFNSFTLRFTPGLFFRKKYIIRVAYPISESEEEIHQQGDDYLKPPKAIEQKRLWINFKILFPTKSIISKIEIEFSNNDWKISDFENQFFTDIHDMFKK